MALPKGSAAYKKKDGTLTLSKDQKSILWSPITPRGAPPGVTINVSDITNLKQTPESLAKVMLKIFVKSPGESEPVTHLFHFNSPTDPRGEANAIRDALTSLITAAKAGDPALPRANGSTGTSAAMAIANAVSSKPGSAGPNWYDDSQLKADIELQQSLMRKDPALHQTYEEARRTKPNTISNNQFNTQFWSSRTNLLRAHAVETHQQRGSYNVLSAVKPRQEDGELKLRISKEQVQLIFSQHPLVKRVYDENVPKLNEAEFWSRFFLSRLFKKLKGERIVEVDTTDPTFDRYLNASDEDNLKGRLETVHVPHVIDIEGNEENQGGAKSGNRQDFTMRPASSAKAPIIRTLNSLSEKIMAHVAPSDVDPANPIGMDEGTYDELVLRDLQGDVEESRIMLNVREQTQFFAGEKSKISAEAAIYAKQNPNDLISVLNADMDASAMGSDSTGGLNLRGAIGVNEESDSEEEDEEGGERKSHVGSRASLKDAQNQVFEGIAQRRKINETDPQAILGGLSQKLFDRLTLTHATTTEFLRNFWTIFLSGDPDRAGELAKMVETLERALDRINAVAADAEREREDEIQRKKQQIRDVWERTGKKLQWNSNSIGGGAKVVKEMLEPTIGALDRASRNYREALATEGVDTS
ncbi:MAG: RNA polymerase II transcription factor B subunit 1 [Claussenomyces sp. TS43310]|nr:MAG: RNA polymerase II transcription factor B subunit 1 [Claussenomyces sp. TS43310]